jgi:hypothetical protein
MIINTIQTPSHIPPTLPNSLAADVGLAAAGPIVDDNAGVADEGRADKCSGKPSMLLELGMPERIRLDIEVDVGAGALVEDDVGATASDVEDGPVCEATLETPKKRFRRPFNEFALPQKLASIMSWRW